MTNQLKEALKAWCKTQTRFGEYGAYRSTMDDPMRNLIAAIDSEPVTERPTDKQPGMPEFVLLPCPFCGVTPQKTAPSNLVWHPANTCALSNVAVPLDQWRYRARIVVDGHVICEGTESLRGQWENLTISSNESQTKRKPHESC